MIEKTKINEKEAEDGLFKKVVHKTLIFKNKETQSSSHIIKKKIRTALNREMSLCQSVDLEKADFSQSRFVPS